jgi:tetratricopeptide (TPR) repeat protein
VKMEDAEPDESEWLEMAGIEIRDLKKFSSCPPLPVLHAAGADALPEPQQSMVASHIAGCRACRITQSDLETLQSPPEKEEEAIRHIRSLVTERLNRERQRRSLLPGFISSWRSALVVATIGFCAFFAFIMIRNRQPLNVNPASQKQMQLTQRDISKAFPLEKPEVRLSLAVLTWRGSDRADGQFAVEIAPALDLYRANRFADAAARLEKLSSKYPDSIEICFYQGISRIFVGDYGSAIQSLEKAQKLGVVSFSADIDWYLALAYQRSGRLPESRNHLASLAAVQGPYSERALKALELLNQTSTLK